MMKNKILILMIVGMLIVPVTFASWDSAEREIHIPIEKGWNLVYAGYSELNYGESPVKGNDFNPKCFYRSDLKEYACFNDDTDLNTDPKWDWIRLLMDDAEKKNKLLQSSLWVYSQKEGDMILHWDAMNEQHLDLSYYNMDAGWNFCSVVPPMVGYSLDELKGDCEIEKAYFYDNVNVDWVEMDTSQVFDASVGGHGFVMRVRETCTLVKSQPIVPELPA
jgi:hypothetical protein